MSAVRLPGQRLVIQREARLRGPGAPTKREIRASEEDFASGARGAPGEHTVSCPERLSPEIRRARASSRIFRGAQNSNCPFR
eukprot:13318609-Alexandrium_andersonii.AAC.1